MSDHVWLTEEGIEILAGLQQLDMIPEGASQAIIGRLIADWREMRELLLSCEDQLPAWREREDIEDMREATGND